MATMPPLTVGMTFYTLEDLEEYVKYYESTNNVILYKKDSRKIAAARKRCPEKEFNDSFGIR